ncbi:chromate efflux transporter [Testudinibacter sp. P80/BLE/0925]|uniref:chromate efflux transporter n=1 Tax=Testudinibacter sp. TW-1 TaxID=3417757 RepID=UPI003D362A0D
MFKRKQDSKSSIKTIFLTFLFLGLTSFGGPIAHLGYFREAFVVRRHWLSDKHYADLVALCQFLPGPASSQVGFAIGLLKGGYPGAIAAWIGFTLPSAIALMLFAVGMNHYGSLLPTGILHGLKIAAVAIVAHAIWGMGKNLITDRIRATIMLLSAIAVLLLASAWGQVAVIIVAAVIGSRFLPVATDNTVQAPLEVRSSQKQTALVIFSVFLLLLIGLPLLTSVVENPWLQRADSFYRAGSLVFGGGHVVLPLLQTEMLSHGWLNDDTFLAGYGAAQAVPGPLFTFAAFLGSAIGADGSPWLSGLFCLIIIFVPSFLLLIAALPFWESLRHQAKAQTALAAVNAAVVGILLAAFYQPIWQKAIFDATDFSIALLAFLLLNSWKLPAWALVLGCAGLGAMVL